MAQAPAAYAQADTVRSVERSVKLPEDVDESSGLAFAAGRLYTVNDGEGVLYELDTLTGEVLSRRTLTEEPIADWEALAIRSDTVYVGDFGNNASGNRTDLRILRYVLPADATVLPRADTIGFTYPEQTDLSSRAPNTTDFDAEAMAVTADSVYVFTKEWRRLGTAVYALPNRPGRHEAQLRGRVDSVGLVTDAHFRPADSLLVLSGYSPILLPFAYVRQGFMGRDFFGGRGLRVQLELPLHQVEGIASLDGRRYFLSHERFERSIFRVEQGLSVLDLGGIVDGLRRGGTSGVGEGLYDRDPSDSPKQGLRVWPNPTDGRVWVGGEERSPKLRLYDASGRQLGRRAWGARAREIDLGGLPAGTYWLARGSSLARVILRW